MRIFDLSLGFGRPIVQHFCYRISRIFLALLCSITSSPDFPTERAKKGNSPTPSHDANRLAYEPFGLSSPKAHNTMTVSGDMRTIIYNVRVYIECRQANIPPLPTLFLVIYPLSNRVLI